jgi:hypothetical protein
VDIEARNRHDQRCQKGLISRNFAEPLCSRADAKMATRLPDVCPDRVRGKYEEFGDLVCSKSFAVEAEDCVFAGAELGAAGLRDLGYF